MYKHILFWLFISVALIAGFGSAYDNYADAFYFVTFLLPVAMGTSYFFNYYLVPEYLLQEKHFRFALYTVYTIMVSLFLQMVVITLSFVVIANYNYGELNPMMTNIFVLAAIIYLIVLLKAFYLLYKRIRNQEFRVRKLLREKDALKKEFISVRENRSNRQVQLDSIIYLESLSDYVKIHTGESVITTKETITFFNETLPEYFIRIHRSFIVNRHFVTRFNSTELRVGKKELPISRTFKSKALEKLTSD